tara:strand:- start:1026 stop:1184 length:159 start_codon:yes stop_codon:yes gene_type:complete
MGSTELSMNLIFTNSPPVFLHQGGWDEMLMFLIPALLLTWLRKKQNSQDNES